MFWVALWGCYLRDMSKQRPQDFAQLGLALVLAISSLTPWIHISVISVAGTATWWGYVTLGGALLIGFDAASKLWPNSIDSQLSRQSRLASIVGACAAILVLGYVGLRLTEASRQFDDSTSSLEDVSSGSDESVLGDEFQESLDEFENSLKEMFKPSLAAGWYMSAISAVGGLVLTVKRRVEDDELPPPDVPPSL